MAVRTFGLLVILASVALAACSKKDEAQERREAEAQVAGQVPEGPATLPTMEQDPGDSASNTAAAGSEQPMTAPGGAAQLPTAVTWCGSRSGPILASSPRSGPIRRAARLWDRLWTLRLDKGEGRRAKG